MPHDDILRQMPPFQGIPCYRLGAPGADPTPVSAMLIPLKFAFRLPDIRDDHGQVLAHGGHCRGNAGDWLVQFDEDSYGVLPNEAIVTEQRLKAIVAARA